MTRPLSAETAASAISSGVASGLQAGGAAGAGGANGAGTTVNLGVYPYVDPVAVLQAALTDRRGRRIMVNLVNGQIREVS